MSHSLPASRGKYFTNLLWHHTGCCIDWLVLTSPVTAVTLSPGGDMLVTTHNGALVNYLFMVTQLFEFQLDHTLLYLSINQPLVKAGMTIQCCGQQQR